MTSSRDSEPASNIPNPGLIPVDILSPVGSPTLDPVVGVSSAAVSTFDSIIGVGLSYNSKMPP